MRIETLGGALKLLTKKVQDGFQSDRTIRVLEAGCGRGWPIDMADQQYSLVGVDIDADAIAIRKAKNDPRETLMVADLRSVDLPSESFDLIYNSYVLEHMVDAKVVLDNFNRWLKPGGMIILRIPDPDGVFGWASKTTPHWFHVMYRKHIAGFKNAGKPGYGPFKVVYEDIVSRRGITQFCASNELVVSDLIGYAEPPHGGKRYRKLLIKTFTTGVRLLSLNKIHDDFINLAFVIRKPLRSQSDGDVQSLKAS